MYGQKSDNDSDNDNSDSDSDSDEYVTRRIIDNITLIITIIIIVITDGD